MRDTLEKLRHSVSFYPLSGAWVAGIASAMLASSGHTTWDRAFYGYTFLILILMLVSMWREVRTVHVLVNSQRTELVNRVDQLTALLKYEGIDLPADPRQREGVR